MRLVPTRPLRVQMGQPAFNSLGLRGFSWMQGRDGKVSNRRGVAGVREDQLPFDQPCRAKRPEADPLDDEKEMIGRIRKVASDGVVKHRGDHDAAADDEEGVSLLLLGWKAGELRPGFARIARRPGEEKETEVGKGKEQSRGREHVDVVAVVKGGAGVRDLAAGIGVRGTKGDEEGHGASEERAEFVRFVADGADEKDTDGGERTNEEVSGASVIGGADG